MVYVRQRNLPALREYKYSSVDRSLVSKHVLKPFYTHFVIKCFPMSMAPNLITLTGFMFVVANFLTLLWYNPGLDQDCPSWVYYSWALGLFLYQTFDAVDGAQARRTKQSGPLGELFDHGVDALNTSLEVLLFAASQNMGQGWRTVATLFASLLTFYVQTWDEYHTKTLTLGIVNGPVEGVLILVAVYALTGYLGGAHIWQASLLGTFGIPESLGIPSAIYNLSFTDWYMVQGGVVLVLNTVESSFNVIRARRGRGGPPPPRFERELKDLASKAKNDTWSSRAASQLSLYAKAGFLLALLGVYANVSQLTLSPVYGSIPAAIWHSKLLMTGCFVGWAGNVALRNWLPTTAAQAIPLVALYIPALQFTLFKYSGQLGAQWGPVATEGLTLFPLAILTAAAVADYLEDARLTMLPRFVADAAPGLGSWGLFKFVEQHAARHLQANMGKVVVYTRLCLELILGALYAVSARSRFLVYALPPLLHTLIVNPHVASPAATSALVSSMMSEGWLLIERRESVTGYVSVVQNMKDGYRVLRCDHSLLGGEWIHVRGEMVAEPIYGVFAMLEAVRLAERETAVADKDAHALVVGLGIGTTPSALVAHGINTTVVEIDPVVHELAGKYFNLKENNPPVLEDAVSYTSALAVAAPETYDYIVHDVFTGGAEPVDLFTLEFLQGLGALLKPDGVIAINYAGDLLLPAPRLIYRTVQQVFPTCRIFREMPPDAEAIKEKNSDFTNMVIFCRKSTTPLTFRAPTTKDYLQSSARQEFLMPIHEIPQAELLSGDDATILHKNDTSVLAKWHEQSALGHWAVMRTALPAMVWEQW